MPYRSGVFFILITLFSISSSYKKSKSIGLELELNHWKKIYFEDPIGKYKILHNPSIIIICERINRRALNSEKLKPLNSETYHPN
jgi:hypothetical protein